jgi:hypothetical protein
LEEMDFAECDRAHLREAGNRDMVNTMLISEDREHPYLVADVKGEYSYT